MEIRRGLCFGVYSEDWHANDIRLLNTQVLKKGDFFDLDGVTIGICGLDIVLEFYNWGDLDDEVFQFLEKVGFTAGFLELLSYCKQEDIAVLIIDEMLDSSIYEEINERI